MASRKNSNTSIEEGKEILISLKDQLSSDIYK